MIVRYSKHWGVDLQESTVRTWKSKYKEELQNTKQTKLVQIKVLPNCKQGCPLLLGEELHTVEAYVEDIRKLACVVNTAIDLRGAKAITANKDGTLVDTLAPEKFWVKSLLSKESLLQTLLGSEYFVQHGGQ